MGGDAHAHRGPGTERCVCWGGPLPRTLGGYSLRKCPARQPFAAPRPARAVSGAGSQGPPPRTLGTEPCSGSRSLVVGPARPRRVGGSRPDPTPSPPYRPAPAQAGRLPDWLGLPVRATETLGDWPWVTRWEVSGGG